MNNWQNLNILWQDYFKLTVYKNDHLITPMFHCFLGVYLTSRYRLLMGGQYKTLRINPFLVQESGSGKSEAMKTTHFLLKKLGFDSYYTLKTTDASLTGSIDLVKGKPQKFDGLLKTKDCIFWDEGSILLRGGAYSETLCDIMQMATDNPGFIARSLKMGTIEFQTETTICAGSYFEENIEKSILRRGILQRLFVIFKNVQSEEILDYIKNKASLVKVNYNEREALTNEIKKILPYNAYMKGKNEKKTIYIDPIAYEKICNEMYNYFTDKMEIFKDEKQTIFNTFISRNDNVVIIAAHKAILEGKEKIDYGDFLYGFSLYKEHLKNVNQILLKKGKVIMSVSDKRKEFVKNVIKNNVEKWSVYKLRDYLVENPNWDLGKLNTYKLINDMIKEEYLKVDLVTEHNKKLISIN